MSVMRTRDGAPETFKAITPSDIILLKGWQYLRVVVAGNLVLKGTDPGAGPVSIPVTAGEYVPFGAGYVMAASTASVVAIG